MQCLLDLHCHCLDFQFPLFPVWWPTSQCAVHVFPIHAYNSSCFGLVILPLLNLHFSTVHYRHQVWGKTLSLIDDEDCWKILSNCFKKSVQVRPSPSAPGGNFPPPKKKTQMPPFSSFFSLPIFSHFSPFSSSFHPFFLFCLFPLEVGPLESNYRVWGSAVSSPSEVWGRAPVEIKFDTF